MFFTVFTQIILLGPLFLSPRFILELKGSINPILSNICSNGVLNYFPIKYYVSVRNIYYEIPRNELAETRFYNDDQMKKINETDSPMRSIKDDPMDEAGILDAHITHLKNVYVNYAASIITQELQFLNICKNPALEKLRSHNPGSLISIENSVVAFGHNHMKCYSHWFYDFLAPLTMIPDDVIRISKFILDESRDYSRRTLKAFGIKDDQIIVAGNDWVYAFNVYIATDRCPHLAHMGLAMRELGKKMKIHFKLTTIKPTQYCLMNRKEGARCIGNLYELYEGVKAKYPKEKFNIIEDRYQVFRAAKVWSTIKFIFTPTGSNCIKGIFMHEHSVMVVALANLRDDCIGMACAANKVFTLFFANVNIPHFQEGYYDIDVGRAMKCIDIGYKCAKEGHWPSYELFKSQ